jgi:hypothetical protein
MKWCTVGKNIFVLGRLEQPRQDKNQLYRHEKPNEPTKESRTDPFHLYSLSPHSPQFQQLAGTAFLYSLSGTSNATSYLTYFTLKYETRYD